MTDNNEERELRLARQHAARRTLERLLARPLLETPEPNGLLPVSDEDFNDIVGLLRDIVASRWGESDDRHALKLSLHDRHRETPCLCSPLPVAHVDGPDALENLRRRCRVAHENATSAGAMLQTAFQNYIAAMRCPSPPRPR